MRFFISNIPQFIIECACGNVRPQKEVLKSKCNNTCPGNKNEYCGGGNVDVGIGFSVYEPSGMVLLSSFLVKEVPQVILILVCCYNL
jgi:hypothetical protein